MINTISPIETLIVVAVVLGIAAILTVSIIYSYHKKQTIKKIVQFELHDFLKYDYQTNAIGLILMIMIPYTIGWFTLMTPPMILDVLYKVFIITAMALIVAIIFLSSKFMMYRKYQNLLTIDAHIESAEGDEDIVLTKLTQPIDVKITKDFVKNIIQNTKNKNKGKMFQKKVDEDLDRFKKGKVHGVIFGLDKEKDPKFGLISVNREWTEYYRGKTDKLPTSIGDIRTTSGHLDLIYAGCYKTIAPNEIKEKLKIDKIDIPWFAINDREGLTPSKAESAVIASARDFEIAAENREQVIASEAERRQWQTAYDELLKTKENVDAVKNKFEVANTGAPPKVSKWNWKTMLPQILITTTIALVVGLILYYFGYNAPHM